MSNVLKHPSRQDKILTVNISANHYYTHLLGTCDRLLPYRYLCHSMFPIHVYDLTFILGGGGDGRGVTGDQAADTPGYF